MSETTAALRYPFAARALELNPLYAALRARHPVCRVRLPYGGEAWLLTRYHDVQMGLADASLSLAEAAGKDTPRAGPVNPAKVPGNLLAMDPPEHTRLRRVVARAFTARTIEQIRPRVQAIADALLQALSASGPPADLVGRLAKPLPAMVIGELLGIPSRDRHWFRALADRIVSTTAATHEEFIAAAAELFSYFAAMLAARREQPRRDLLTVLAQAHPAQHTDQELATLAIAILVGGYETTASEIANMAYTLLTHPDHLSELRRNPGALPRAVEEMLRHIPLGSGAVLPRIALRDITIRGEAIRAGDAVLASRSAANRDESVFACPDALDFGRAPNPHVAFGYGPHRCLGAHLARVELQVAIAALVTRFPAIHLAVPAATLTWQAGRIMRAPQQLPVKW